MKYKILRYDKPAGKDGTDVTVRFTDDVYGIDAVVTFWWEKGGEPILTDLSERLTHIGQNLVRKQQEMAQEAYKQPRFQREEVKEWLVSKGYITKDQDIDDLPSKEELLASRG